MTETTSQNQAPESEVDFVALQPGQTIGRYEISAVLGQGGFGITYRARDTQLERDIAVKILPEAFARDPGWRLLATGARNSLAIFLRESR